MSVSTMTSLSAAFKKNANSFAEAQLTYQQNVIAVNVLMNGVYSTKLPTLNTPPSNWNDFQSTYNQARAYALGWFNDVLTPIMSVPQTVQGYNDSITSGLNNAALYVGMLQADPNNTQALTALQNSLIILNSQLEGIITDVNGVLNDIQNFNNNLPTMADELNSLAETAIADANADQEEIDNLQAQVAQLQADVEQLALEITAFAITDTVAFTLGTAATIAAFPEGALTWLVMGPIVAISTTAIIVDSVKISEDNAAIEAAQNQIALDQQDVTTLTLLASQYSFLASSTEAIETNVTAILTEWQTLQGDVLAALDEIQAALNDAESNTPDYDDIAGDLNAAVIDWNDSYAQAGALILDISASTGEYSFGMTADEAQQVLDSSQTVPMSVYINEYA